MKIIPYLIVASCCLTARLAFAEKQPEVEVEVLVESGKSWDGARLPSYPAEKPEITVLKVVIPVQGTVDWHKHPAINACYVMAGELTVEAEDGEELNVRKGDAFVELVNQWHCGRNRGREPVELIVFYAGKRGEPLTIKKESR